MVSTTNSVLINQIQLVLGCIENPQLTWTIIVDTNKSVTNKRQKCTIKTIRLTRPGIIRKYWLLLWAVLLLALRIYSIIKVIRWAGTGTVYTCWYR
jgi:hypothetical protein